MDIDINIDHNIAANETRAAKYRKQVEDAMTPFGRRILRVEVHLSAEKDGGTGPHDMRCTMETLLEGYQPMVVTHQATSLEQAVGGAAGMLRQLIGSALGIASEKDGQLRP